VEHTPPTLDETHAPYPGYLEVLFYDDPGGVWVREAHRDPRREAVALQGSTTRGRECHDRQGDLLEVHFIREEQGREEL
jgi:hypothetical protein